MDSTAAKMTKNDTKRIEKKRKKVEVEKCKIQLNAFIAEDDVEQISFPNLTDQQQRNSLKSYSISLGLIPQIKYIGK